MFLFFNDYLFIPEFWCKMFSSSRYNQWKIADFETLSALRAESWQRRKIIRELWIYQSRCKGEVATIRAMRRSPTTTNFRSSSSDSTYGKRDSSSGWLLNAAHSFQTGVRSRLPDRKQKKERKREKDKPPKSKKVINRLVGGIEPGPRVETIKTREWYARNGRVPRAHGNWDKFQLSFFFLSFFQPSAALFWLRFFI